MDRDPVNKSNVAVNNFDLAVNKSDLAGFQQDFSRALFQRDDEPVLPLLSGDLESLNRQRLDIYRNNVFHSLGTALGDLYPVIKRLVGEPFFMATAAEYIRQRPPDRAAMVFFGGDFPVFLQDFTPARDLVYLADVARLELAWHRAYHAEDRDPLTATALAAIDPDQLAKSCLRLHPSVQLLSSRYPVLKIWLANQEGADDQVPIDLDAGGEAVCIHRPVLEVQVLKLDTGTVELLRGLASGLRLGQAITEAVTMDGDFDPGPALGRCISSGLFFELYGD